MITSPVPPSMRLKLLAVLVAACYGTAYGSPSGPQVVAGQATFVQQGNLFSITNTPNTIINWQNFSINPNEITRFIQQSGDSKVLNRIVGQDPSAILGALQSNGKVYLINPNGVLFGKDARVDVNGLVASSLAISNSDFLAGKNHFSGNGAGKVVNQGSITTPAGGQVYLIGAGVENSGVITSPQGEVLLAAGNSVLLVDSANPEVHVVLSAPADQALNLGQVLAAGGKVGIYGALVNQRGRINANSAVLGEHGKIVLKASGAGSTTLLEAGSQTSATNSAGKGGEIQLLGERVGLSGNAAVDASGASGGGTVLIGGDYQGQGDGSRAAVPHAQQTYIGADASVRADATGRGDGGTIIAWSDGSTRVVGQLSARGGALGGNGGLVETSGHYLDMRGKVDTRAQAPDGKTGTLLLDPTDIYIAQDATAAFYGGGMPLTAPSVALDASGKIFEAASAAHDSLLTTGTLQGLLNSTDVTVRTTSSGSGDGSIHLISALEWDSGKSLTLQANKDINLKAGIQAPNAAVHLDASGGSIVQTGSSAGMTAKSLSASAAGNITLDHTGNNVSDSMMLSATTGDITLSGTSIKLGDSSAGGTLTASAASGDLAVTGNVTAVREVALSTLAGGGHRITNSGSVTSGVSIALSSDKMTLAGGTLSAPLVRLASGNGINIGATSNVAGTLELSEADLHTVEASELQLTVASGEGDIVLSAPLSVGQRLALTSRHAISLGAALSSGGLTLSAPGDISASGSVAVNGVFNLVQGDWSQNSATLPDFSATDFRLSGGSFLRGYGTGDSGYLLSDIYGLQGVGTLETSRTPSQAFTLGGNIDASGTAQWNGGAGFKPIAYTYTGLFDGNNKAILGLVIHRPDSDNVGLFSYLGNGSTVRNLAFQGGAVSGGFKVGALAGNAGGAIIGVASSASVSGVGSAGGLIGSNTGSITTSGATGAVTGGEAQLYASSIGGLVGISSGAISSSFATGAVSTTGQGYAGGLVGTNNGSVTESYASGAVGSTGEIVGGLVGDNYGSIARSYASGNVAGGRNVGGLVGRNHGGSINDVYASGNVSRLGNNSVFEHDNAGGLLGEFFAGTVSNAFSTGQVNGAGFGSYVGGLVGYANGYQVTHGFYDTDKAGRSNDYAGGIGLSTAQTRLQSSFPGLFGAETAWRIYDGDTIPLLKAFLKPVTVSVTGNNASVVYGDALPSFTGGVPTYTGLLDGDALSGTLGWGNVRDVGVYGAAGLFSTKYNISYADGAPLLNITRRELSATIVGSKVYDGNTEFSNASVTLANLAYGDAVSASVSASFADKNAGTGKALSNVELQLSEGASRNYTLQTGYVSAADITRAPLSINGITGVSRVYNGGTAASINAASDWSAHALSNDVVTAVLAGGNTFNNKNVGVGKTIHVPLTLSGTDAGNYLPYTSTSADISAAPLSVTGLTGVNRVYDGTAVATVSNATFGGVFGNDVVSLGTVQAQFVGGKNVGNNKVISFAGLPTLGGADAGNYQVTGSMPTNVSANITPAPLTVGISAQNRAYNGGTNITLSLAEGGYLNGVMQGDSVSLNSAGLSASVADRGVGNDKPVTLTGLALNTSPDAGNYVLTAPALTANITQLAKATWTGNAGNSLWSDAGNWADGAVPVSTYVLSAELSAYGGAVIYDGGTTTLSSLSSVHGQGLTISGGALTLGLQAGNTSSLAGGALSLSNGALNLVGSLTSGSYAQAGGTLSGSGSLTTNSFSLSGGAISGLAGLTINSQYAHSGGSIAIPGAVAINHYGSNLVVGPISALESIALNTGEGGAISQSGALNTGSLTVGAQNGVVLNNSANHILHFSGSNSGAGGISLRNTLSGSEQLGVGPLNTGSGSLLIDNVGGIYTAGILSASGGTIALTAHSPILIDSLLQADNISLSASTEITLTGDANLQAGHNIAMTAGTGISLAGTLNSSQGSINLQTQSGGITADSDMHITGSGAITLSAPNGAISAPLSIFQGGSAPVLNDSAAVAAAEAAAKAAAEAAAKAAADAAAKAAADAAAKAAADAAAKAAADAAAKAAADAAAKAAADAAAKAAADAAAKAAADAAAKAAADAAAKAAADAAAKAAADAAAKAAADAAAKAAADAAEKALADAAAKAAADAAAKAAADAAAKAAADAAAKAAADAAAKAAADAAAKAAADAAAAKAAADAAATAAQNDANAPVGQAVNSTVNIINNAAGTASKQAGASADGAAPNGASAPADGAGGSSAASSQATDSKKDDSKKDEKESGPSTLATGKNDSAKKMYCN